MLKKVLVVLLSSVCAVSAFAQVDNFRYEQNVTHPGGDYDHKVIGSVDECANECARDARCLSFSYDKGKQTCWLKNSVPPTERNSDVVSGVKERQEESNQTDSMSKFNISSNTTLPGSDFTHFGSDSVEQCASQCAKDSRCLAFAYDKVKRTCWLKDSVPPSEHNGDIVSGVKR